MVFEACGSAAASVAVPRKQGLDRNRPGWRDNQLRDWERTLSLVPHGFKPLLSLSLSLSLWLSAFACLSAIARLWAVAARHLLAVSRCQFSFMA